VYLCTHLQRAGNTGEMALAANRENTWVNINTRLVKEIEQLREVCFAQ
jgi:hypothetical protein